MLTKDSSTVGSSRISLIGALAGAEKLNQDLTCSTLDSLKHCLMWHKCGDAAVFIGRPGTRTKLKLYKNERILK